MNKTKYTPGPWETGRPDMATLVEGVDSKWIYAGDIYIAVASGCASENWDEVMANARLIAAAPELLAACELVLEVLDQDSVRDSECFWLIKRAIAKAKGE